MFTNALREATSEHEIFFLLTSYAEAVRYCDKIDTLPGPLKELPIAGVNDVVARVDALRAIAGTVEREERAVVTEALDIFSAALLRLGTLASGDLERLPIAA